MCFRISVTRLSAIVLFAIAAATAISCGTAGKIDGIRARDVEVGLSLSAEKSFDEYGEDLVPVVAISSDECEEPLIMNAIRDTETGEMVATDVIAASRVTARFRNVAERFGKVSIEFDITVPASMMDSRWRMKFVPVVKMLDDSLLLAPVYVTGRKYRDEQMRGYRRYEAFVSSIVTDSTDFIRKRQLDLFLRRYFHRIYAMKNDSTFISDSESANIFGVSREDALWHYTKHGMQKRNEFKKSNLKKMFCRYVKDPLVSGVKDTVIVGANGDIVHRYVQQLECGPGIKKLELALSGTLYEDGEYLCDLPEPEDLVYYVSSLSSLIDNTPHYLTKIVERVVYDNTVAMIEFASGSSLIDTLLAFNAEELGRIRHCVSGIMDKDEFDVDSISVVASCSPEGLLDYNTALAESRAKSVIGYLENCSENFDRELFRPGFISENWEKLTLLVENDTVLTDKAKERILIAASEKDKDNAEKILQQMPEYGYLEECIYPKLRHVSFGFYLHRKGMQQDTLITSELDTTYLKGVEAIRNMQYGHAVELLGPYRDYNTALAYLASGYDNSAADILESLDNPFPKARYLQAVVLSRFGEKKKALDCYLSCIKDEPSLVYRANLDPELLWVTHYAAP